MSKSCTNKQQDNNTQKRVDVRRNECKKRPSPSGRRWFMDSPFEWKYIFVYIVVPFRLDLFYRSKPIFQTFCCALFAFGGSHKYHHISLHFDNLWDNPINQVEVRFTPTGAMCWRDV